MSPQPERTCIGCGRKAGPADLVRLVSVDGQVAVDRERRGGRGAWMHPAEACLEKAVRRKAFGRAFRGPAMADPERLRGQLTGIARRD